MMFILITTVLVIQTYILYLFRKRETFGLQWVVSIGFLLLYFLLFPELILYTSGVRDQECGIPIVGIYLAFWVFGTAATIVSTSLGYLIWSRTRQKRIN